MSKRQKWQKRSYRDTVNGFDVLAEKTHDGWVVMIFAGYKLDDTIPNCESADDAASKAKEAIGERVYTPEMKELDRLRAEVSN
jgi:hypothetical protein